MKPIYKVFYREKGIRYSDRLLRLPSFNLTVLPRSSLFHYVSDDINSPEVDTSLPFLQGYSKKILLDYVTDYVKTEGAVRRPMFAMKELTRNFRREHRQTWIFEPEAYKLNQNPETLIVINYGYLDVVHKYIPVMMANYHRWLNRQNTIWANVNKIASSSERHQFIFYPIAKILQGRTILEKYAKESPSIKMMQIFGSHGDGGYLQLDMWKWLNPATRKQSLLGQIDPRHYNKINLVFQGTSGNQALVNLGYLNSWIKGQPNTTEFGSIVQFEPLFIQKLFLKMSMSLNAIETNEENMEGLDEIENSKTPSQIAPIPKTLTEPSSQDIEEGEVSDTELDKTSTISEDDVEEKEDSRIESGFVQKAKVLPKKGPLEKEPESDTEIALASFTSSFMDEVEKDIEALDKLSLTQLKNKGTKLNAEDPLIEEELIDLDQVRAKVYQSKPPSDRLKDWISEDAEANLITASEYRKLEQSIESYRESKDPYGSDAPRIEVMVIKEEDVVLSPEKTKIELSDTVPDVTMGNSTLKAFDTQYLRNVYKKDILQAIDSVQNAGVVIKNHEIEVRHSALGSYEHHRLELKPVDGMPSTIQFTLPQVNEDGTFTASGNLYLLRKQRIDLVLRKIAPQIVSLSTYYGKTFVQTSSKVVNNDLAWLYREINAASLQQGLLIHEVNPGNVFDHDFKGPYIYNALAQEYEQFKVGDYSLYFDHRVRDKRVNPELLKIIEKKGRVWCGWSKDKSPIVVDKDNIFYEVRRDGETRLGNIYEFLELDTTKCPINFAETRVFSKYIPVGVMLSYYLGFSALIALLGEQYRVVPAKKNKQLEKDEYAISFRDESYIFKTKNKANTLILAGFQDFEKVTKLYDRKDFEHKDVYLNLLLTKKMSAIYVRELDMMQHAFIDPISKEVLQDMGEPTTFIALVIRAVEMLMNYDHPASQDRAAMRDRGYERFAGTVYKETMQAIRQFRNKNLVGRSKIDMSPYQIWNAIMKDSALKIVEDTNPIQNLKESEVITFAGTGGRDKDTITKPARAYHKNDLGVLSESTVDSTAVGTIAYLSADPNIKNVRGLMRGQKSLSPTNILSTSALLSPASMNDN